MSTGGFDAAAWTSYAKALVPSESIILSGAGRRLFVATAGPVGLKEIQ